MFKKSKQFTSSLHLARLPYAAGNLTVILYCIFFMFMGPRIVNQCQQLSNKMRLYTVYFISVNCSTRFGW